jgi:poly-gamma-glutamate capsule biosynthesis protein CapA/YwtB (metallophosphatase superfamily)
LAAQNTRKDLRCSFIYLLIVSLLAACQAAIVPASNPDPEVSAAPSLAATQTVIPTIRPAATSTPTAAHLPTLTPSLTATPQTTPTEVPITRLLFTGVIVPARCVQAALDSNGNPNYPYEEVREIIQSADLAVGTLNATIGDYAPHTGCKNTYVLVGSSNNADALAWAGFDVMSVATNHIKNCGLMNCGDRAFFETLENLRRVNILPVGAGANHAEAMQPVVIEVNGVRFGIVSLGQIEPMAFAGDDSPGIAVLNEGNLRSAIQAARAVSDVVIAMPHWGPEDVAVPNWIQRGLADDLIDAGADVVVGNHTHVIQAIQEIEGVPVFYGLGNFVFDQGLRDHRQGGILVVNFEGVRYLGYEFIPTHVDRDGRVHIADPEEAAEILQRLEQVSAEIR